ncbi:MAG: PLP-dependent aminotransferase family protein [Roseburia sp.]
MLTYSFTDLGSDFLYEHLYKCLKNDILSGNLAAGTKLPSKRSFAKNLGISTITVENAYAQLMAEGYIYSIPKKGFYITDIKTISKPDELKLSAENVQLTSGKTSYIADFTSNQTCSENFPFSIWSKLIRELLSDSQIDLMTNPPCGGILPLRQAIADHLRAFHGLQVSPEQIIIGAGTEYLYSLIIQLLGIDKKYAVEDPGYNKIAQIYNSHHATCEHVGMDNLGIRIPALEEQSVDVVHISPSHHFPTGIVMPISRRYELLGWASKSDSRYIIEDDYDSEFRLTGQPIPTLQSIDVLEKVIYINTFTKTLSSTVRISYMVLPNHLLEKFYSKLSFYSCTVSNFEQYTLAHFIQQGYFEKHLNRMRNYYHQKRDLLLSSIKNSPLSSYVSISEEDAGLHFLMKIETDLDDEDFCRKAEQHGIRLSPLSQYYVNAPDNARHIFVMNYSSLSEDRIEEAIQCLYLIVR